MKKFTLLAASAAALALAASAAQATTIDTTSFWDGSNNIDAFGGNATGVYGESFVAPGGNLTNFTFYINDFGSALGVVAQVYAWSGALVAGSDPQGATGAALFSSPFTIAGVDGFQPVSVATGGVALTTGSNYVILLADVSPGDGDSVWGLTGAGFGSHPGVPFDGGFQFHNNDHTLGTISGAHWDSRFVDFGSLAYTASFSGGVPEPATWALMLGGFGLAGGALRAARRRQAATA